MKIYAIVTGEYSDWSLVGYFNNKDEAERFCLSRQGEYDEPYVRELDLLSITEKEKAIEILKYHEVLFDNRDGKWIMRKEPKRYKIYSGKKTPTHSGIWPHNKRIFYANISTQSRKKAEKIAQDLMYKHLAMEENI